LSVELGLAVSRLGGKLRFIHKHCGDAEELQEVAPAHNSAMAEKLDLPFSLLSDSTW
jgi:hypothetical protein